jgi:argininosuccinate lyase
MKLWDKGTDINKKIEEFTVGRDRELDLLLARYDVLGSLAHIEMLESIGLLSKDEHIALNNELREIFMVIENNHFTIDKGIEDVHSQVEYMLTKKLGDAGKKIHSARSRNDQVLLDIKLFTRAKLINVADSMAYLFSTLLELSEKHKDFLMPGYTHLQIAMPSSFGLWFGAYAESLTDDLQLLLTAYNIANQNPLGSAAGYGSSFPINRQMTTDLLGFECMNYNVIYAQMGRGKVERIVAFALGSVANTLAKLAYDICLFNSQNFNFIKLPDEFTTGSSIMPHKKNPDVFELIRAKSNKLQSLTNEVTMITNNLPSGYFRDFQIIKESYLESFDNLIDCIDITSFILQKVQIKDKLLLDEKYKEIFSVEEVNREVQKGVPFREAYKMVADKIKKGNFNSSLEINHSHEGSIGNLCNQQINNKFQTIFGLFNRSRIENAEKALLKG